MAIDELSSGDVVVRVAYSSLNYKDARAVTGRGRPIMRRTPLNAGIDLAGVVESSTDSRFTPGMPVIANGMGLGEAHDGGFAEYARVPADWLIPLPGALTLRAAMAFGTAGYTAALCVHRMEIERAAAGDGADRRHRRHGGVGRLGPAAGGARLSGDRGLRTSRTSWLAPGGRRHRRTHGGKLALGDKPLEHTRFGGAIDNVGGTLLAQLLPHVVEWGNVASVGLAGGAEFSTSVYPFILRGVSLSARAPPTARWRCAARSGTAGRRFWHRRRALRDEGDWAGRSCHLHRVARPAARGVRLWRFNAPFTCFKAAAQLSMIVTGTARASWSHR